MKHSKLIFGAGTLLLAVVGALAGRASAKFSITTVYFTTGSATKHCASMTGLLSGAFTTAGTGVQATMKTVAGSASTVKLWATSTCSTGGVPIHFKL